MMQSCLQPRFPARNIQNGNSRSTSTICQPSTPFQAFYRSFSGFLWVSSREKARFMSHHVCSKLLHGSLKLRKPLFWSLWAPFSELLVLIPLNKGSLRNETNLGSLGVSVGQEKTFGGFEIHLMFNSFSQLKFRSLGFSNRSFLALWCFSAHRRLTNHQRALILGHRASQTPSTRQGDGLAEVGGFG